VNETTEKAIRELLADLVAEAEEIALMQNDFTTSDYQGALMALPSKYLLKIAEEFARNKQNL